MKRYLIILIISFAYYQISAQGCDTPTEEGVNVFGFFQPQYDFRLYDDMENTFRFNRMRMGVMGVIPYDFSYYALLEMSPFVQSDGSIFLIDAFVTYSRYNNFRVSVGSFKKPFGQELSMACSGLYTIERSKFVNEFTGPNNRDLGLMILGGNDTTRFEYRLALMNGTGPGLSDNNNFKDIYGRLMFRPVPFVQMGLNYLYGEDPAQNESSESNDKRERWGTDLKVNFNKFTVFSEYIYSRDVGSYTTGGGCDGAPIEIHQGSKERSGFYVMGAYNLTYNLQPVIKYEQYDTDLDISGSNNQIITYGINYFFNDWTRLQINYQYQAEDPTEVKNDALLVQVQVKF